MGCAVREQQRSVRTFGLNIIALGRCRTPHTNSLLKWTSNSWRVLLGAAAAWPNRVLSSRWAGRRVRFTFAADSRADSTRTRSSAIHPNVCVYATGGSEHYSSRDAIMERMEQQHALIRSAFPPAFAGCLPSLTWKQRLTGCAVCFLIGMLVSVFATFALVTSPTTFGVLYTFGNLLSLLSTGFLVGPMRQFKNMFHRKRITATLVFLALLIGTLAVAFGTGSTIGTLVMVLFQFLALAWYTISYIPYARDVVRKAIGGCFGKGGR